MALEFLLPNSFSFCSHSGLSVSRVRERTWAEEMHGSLERGGEIQKNVGGREGEKERGEREGKVSEGEDQREGTGKENVMRRRGEGERG